MNKAILCISTLATPVAVLLPSTISTYSNNTVLNWAKTSDLPIVVNGNGSIDIKGDFGVRDKTKICENQNKCAGGNKAQLYAQSFTHQWIFDWSPTLPMSINLTESIIKDMVDNGTIYTCTGQPTSITAKNIQYNTWTEEDKFKVKTAAQNLVQIVPDTGSWTGWADIGTEVSVGDSNINFKYTLKNGDRYRWLYAGGWADLDSWEGARAYDPNTWSFNLDLNFNFNVFNISATYGENRQINIIATPRPNETFMTLTFSSDKPCWPADSHGGAHYAYAWHYACWGGLGHLTTWYQCDNCNYGNTTLSIGHEESANQDYQNDWVDDIGIDDNGYYFAWWFSWTCDQYYWFQKNPNCHNQITYMNVNPFTFLYQVEDNPLDE